MSNFDHVRVALFEFFRWFFILSEKCFCHDPIEKFARMLSHVSCERSCEKISCPFAMLHGLIGTEIQRVFGFQLVLQKEWHKGPTVMFVENDVIFFPFAPSESPASIGEDETKRSMIEHD